jgi:DNA polymerase I
VVEYLAEAESSHKLARLQGFPADTISLKDDKLAVGQWLELNGVAVPKTAKGAYSLAKDGIYLAIDGNQNGIELPVKNFFKGKELNKLVNDYLSKMDQDRCHPDIRSIGAVTGRQSVGNPPFHQLPDSVRGCIVPDDGMVLGTVDLDRIEFCVAAGLAQDTAMINAIKEGIDLHARTAAMVHGGSWQEWLGTPERNHAKGAGFGRMFGGGAATLAKQQGIPEEEMAKFISGFDRAYPQVKQFGRRLGSQDWVINPWGRRIPADPIRRYGNLNYAIQSTAREIFVDWMLACIKNGVQVLLPLHDEVVFQATARDSLETVVDCLRKDFMGVPLTAGGKTMDRWSKG